MIATVIAFVIEVSIMAYVLMRGTKYLSSEIDRIESMRDDDVTYDISDI